MGDRRLSHGHGLIRSVSVLASLILILLLSLPIFLSTPSSSVSNSARTRGPLPPLPLGLPSVGALAGFSFEDLPPEAELSLTLGRLALTLTSELGLRPPFPLPQELGKEEASKLDPLLRIILRLDRWARERGEPLDLTGFAPLIQVYSPTAMGAVRPRPVPTVMREFFPSTPPPEAGAGGRWSWSWSRGWEGRLAVLIRTSSPMPPGLTTSGVEVITTVGEIEIAWATPDQLRRLAREPEVIYIEPAYRLASEIDKSVPAIGVDLLREEEPPLTGRGVIIGLVDTGIDYEHLDFRFDSDGDGFEESSRILFIWDQTETEAGPAGAVPFGREYTREEIEADLARGLGPEEGLVRTRDEFGHGTHVAGIAAGDGSASGVGYVGVAPEAELIVVKTGFYTSDVLAGVDYIFRRAEELSRPCVVNLSLGGHFGPHDGTSNFDLALEGLLGPGRAIVTSAGNEGDDRVHISGRLTHPGSTAQFTFIPEEETVYLNIWYPGEAEFAVELGAPVSTGELVQVLVAEPGEVVLEETAAGSVSIDNASGGPDPRNGDHQIAILLEGVTPGRPWTIRLRARSGSGRFDGWPGLAEMGEFLEGDGRMTITEPGNARGIITVGAWTTRVEWRSIDGKTYHFRGAGLPGAIAPFSSRGPTRDGRRKPDLAAPGTAIVSALARGSELAGTPELVVPDGVHAIMEGTSMAAPHVAGTVALMFQASPTLEPGEAGENLRRAATRDNLTTPDEVWGSGRLNATRGVSLLGLALPEAGGQPEVKAGTNPASERVLFTYALPPGTKRARLIVYNVVGQAVFTAELDLQGERFTWELVNDAGEPLANGLYIYVVVADGRRSSLHRLVIRR